MRVSLFVDDVLVVGASFRTHPNNDEELIELLEHLILAIKAPKKPYTDDLDPPHPEAVKLANEINGWDGGMVDASEVNVLATFFSLSENVMTTYVALEDVMKYLDSKIAYYDNDGSMSSMAEWVHNLRFAENLKEFKKEVDEQVRNGTIRSA